MTYMANILVSKEEKDELLAAFQALDEDGNGILTKQELVKGRPDLLRVQKDIPALQRS